ncbi:MAG: hypothetical protein A2W91_00080 [Bacteroidetes bacterium GWF2_38_335]|nr:MAG: hypothetical protein A2W91_00080 [Bacteroidetes bacterium GWF2_38_335]OFY79718.1 MAG: hypothetical protein A2281_09675 [Bacteroidetes bacterium RIFOXYA12_FULL_38_20]HBS87576.1 hypothetical protein [Bacteroidales bacterium]
MKIFTIIPFLFSALLAYPQILIIEGKESPVVCDSVILGDYQILYKTKGLDEETFYGVERAKVKNIIPKSKILLNNSEQITSEISTNPIIDLANISYIDYAYNSKNNLFSIFIVNYKNIHVFCLDSNMLVDDRMSGFIDKLDINCFSIGGLIEKDFIYLFFLDRVKAGPLYDLYCCVINKKTKEFKYSKVFDFDDEKIVSVYETGESINILTIEQEKSDSLHLYKWFNDTAKQLISYKPDKIPWLLKDFKNYSCDTKFPGFSVYYGDYAYSLANNKNKNKIYLFEDSLMITCESLDCTEILTLGLNDTLSGFKNVIRGSLPKPEFSNTIYNSCVYDKKLFQVESNETNLKFQIYNFETNSIVYSFISKNEEKYFIQNSAFISEKNDKKGIKKTDLINSQIFLKKLSSLELSVNRINDNYEIIIGSFKPIIMAKPQVGIYVSTGNLLLDLGLNVIANNLPGSSYSSCISGSNCVYFKTVFDHTATNHIEKDFSSEELNLASKKQVFNNYVFGKEFLNCGFYGEYYFDTNIIHMTKSIYKK